MSNVIVTGGSRGLGLGIAHTLRAAGYDVVAVARSESEPLAAALAEPAAEGRGALYFMPFDLADLAGIPDFVGQIRKRARAGLRSRQQCRARHQRRPGDDARP